MRPGDLLEQRYRLVRVLGRGRSGSVWCARNELIDRAVAVKVLHRSLASDPERLQRFFQEARACGRVRHPSVVEVLDLGQGDDGVLFLVMELLEGETMASLLGRKGRLSTDEALSLVIPLAHGLGAAHAHGILHRDLKPANIYLHKTPTGGLQPKILDFGISKIIGNDVTATGVVLGTPSYMSPEQARGVPDLDPRTDVWSLGVILYEALTGRLPFVAKEYRALVDEIIDKRHAPVDQVNPDVPSEVARIVDEALEKSRERRLSSASTFAQKLTTVLRARGRGDMLRDPDDEFSEGAPTLARDREPPNAPSIDDTVGDHAPLAAVEPPPSSPVATKPGTGPSRPMAGAPSPITAAIAAQTSGAKRLAQDLPRPAAGSPAKPLRSSTGAIPAVSAPASAEPEETRPDPVPLARRAEGPKPQPARPASTQSWEISAAQAASGRAEVLLGNGVSAHTPASTPAIKVDEDWDTTVADVSSVEIEKGPLPKLAPAPPPAFSEPPPASKRALERNDATRTSAERPSALRGDAPSKKSIGPIPGFTAPTPGAPPVAKTNGASHEARAPSRAAPSTPPPRSAPSSTPPPARVAPSSPPPPPRASVEPEAAPKKGPPRAPPKSLPPNRSTTGRTLRPPVEGFAAPASPSVRPPEDAPLIAPELLALGENKIEAQPASEPQPFDLVSTTDPRSDHNGNGAHVLTADPTVETDRHRRAGASIVPMMVAAVAVLFVFGAAIGAVAASSRRSDDHNVRRFASSLGLLVAWHDHAVRVASEETTSKESTKQVAAADPPPPDPSPAPSSAPPSESAKPPAETPAPKPPPPAAVAPKPSPPAPAKTTHAPKSTAPTKTTAPAKTTATTKSTTSPPPEKKKSGDKEWWQKKF